LNAASKHLGQPIIPINKPGGSGAITAMAVKTAKPDGYTLGDITVSTAFAVPFSEGAPYKDVTGFTWINNFGSYVYPLLVRGDAPWKTWKEFIEWAKKNPRATKFGTTGAKTADYKALVMWQIEKKENAELTFLTFKGSPQVLVAILGGHINLYGSTTDITTMSYVQEGKLRFLAYVGTNKVPGYENIPSTQELYGFNVPDLLAVIGPPGLPDYVIRKLEDAFAKAIKDPDFIKAMNRMSMPIVYMDRATLTKYVEKTFSDTSKIMQKVKAEEKKNKK
ncbi:MAG: tripartite tricarboxylate transporter substrate binding protein, partial [Pseudomonadota bacterium]